MALLDRIFRDNLGDRAVNDYDGSIANHAFSAAVWFLLTRGTPTRAQLMAAFGMDATDDPQLDELAADYAARNANDKRTFHEDLEAAGVLAEGGFITRVIYKSFFGMS